MSEMVKITAQKTQWSTGVQEEHPLAPNYFIQVHVENNNREKVQPL